MRPATPTGDSHTVALTEAGAIWAWGTFRDASGVFGFSPSERIALLPTLVHCPGAPDERVVKIASGEIPPPAHRVLAVQAPQTEEWLGGHVQHSGPMLLP